MQIQVFRIDKSSYQSDDFLRKEKQLFEAIHPKLTYTCNIQELDPENSFILISNTHTNVDELPQIILEKTILMIHPNSGHDNINQSFIHLAQFPIISGNVIRKQAVTEYILSCLFHHFSPIDNFSHWPNTRVWDRKLLRDQKVLVYGYGHIGCALDQSLAGICSDVYFIDPKLESNPLQKRYSSTEELEIESFDIHILAASLTDSSKHLFNLPYFEKLKKGAIIVNPARGEIIDSESLKRISRDKEFVFFFDVFEQEPFSPGYLKEVSQLNRTPHIAGVYKNLCDDILDFEIFITKKYLSHLTEDTVSEFYTHYNHSILNPREIGQ